MLINSRPACTLTKYYNNLNAALINTRSIYTQYEPASGQ